MTDLRRSIDGLSLIVQTELKLDPYEKAPTNLLRKSMASNELLSHVICLKYQFTLPLYRQETYFDMLGGNLSRQTLSNWVISAASEFEGVYDIMKERLLESHYI